MTSTDHTTPHGAAQRSLDELTDEALLHASRLRYQRDDLIETAAETVQADFTSPEEADRVRAVLTLLADNLDERADCCERAARALLRRRNDWDGPA